MFVFPNLSLHKFTNVEDQIVDKQTLYEAVRSGVKLHASEKSNNSIMNQSRIAFIKEQLFIFTMNKRWCLKVRC